MAFLRRTKAAEPPRRRAGLHRIEDEGNKFRRSATLTGSLSDNVRAGAEERGQLQTTRLEAQAHRRRRRKMLRRMGVLGVIISVAIILYANRISSYQVSFTDNPVHLPDATSYVKTAREFSASSPGNGFGFSLNTAALGEYLVAHHREIQAVKVHRQLFATKPQIEVTLRHPVLIWQTSHDSQAFYVDANGISFSFDAYSNKDAGLVHVNDESGVPAQLGVPVASSRQISFLGQLVGQIATSSDGKITVAKIVFPPSSTKEIDVYLTGRNYFAKVYLDRSGRAQAEELMTAVSTLQQKGKQPSQYIDVRVAERVFYK